MITWQTDKKEDGKIAKLKFLEDTSIFIVPLIPLFWTSGDVYPEFQRQSESLVCFLSSVILRFTSGGTPADCTEVSMSADPFPSIYLQKKNCQIKEKRT